MPEAPAPPLNQTPARVSAGSVGGGEALGPDVAQVAGGVLGRLAQIRAWRRRSGIAFRLDSRQRRLVGVAVGVSGWVFATWLWIVGTSLGEFRISGDVSQIFLPAGQAFWSGGSPYDLSLTPAGRPFLYAPPWAAIFGLLAPLGAPLVHALLVIGSLIALRTMARSWLRAGAFCWFFLVPWEIASGQLNILCAAAVVAAIRGRPAAAAILGWAKISPIFGVRPRDWRPFLIALALFAALGFVRPDLWLAWVTRLLWAAGQQLGPLVPIPFIVRLPVGLALILTGRRVPRALGAVIITPGLYWSALALLIAPVAVFLDPPGASAETEAGVEADADTGADATTGGHARRFGAHLGRLPGRVRAVPRQPEGLGGHGHGAR